MKADKSKAFRCVLPPMREDQVSRLQLWALSECALSALFANPYGKVVMVALRDRERSACSHSRTLRSVLRRFAIDDRSLRGTWLNLITVQEGLQLCSSSSLSIRKQQRQQEQQQKQGKDDASDEARTVTLR